MTELQQRALEILRESLGNQDAEFHEHQWESISTLVEKRGRLLVVQRTGWGKSAVYFIATKLMREQGYGPTLIISPLLALMRNQIESAARYGVRLGSVNSSQSIEENELAAEQLKSGGLDAIIISPEQLAKEDFRDHALLPIADSVGLFVVDEAHCISDWGHDFRPDYKRIINLLKFLPPNMPVLATTATANERVMEDVTVQLGSNIQSFRGKLTRESLHLQTFVFPRRTHRLAWLADTLPNLKGTGIIYTATIRDAELVARWLRSRNITAEAYYGAVNGPERQELEEALLNNKLKALVATSALGMGYDKPDLSFVIHYQSPGSVVGYYQQVGRAGRAIPKALGILLSGNEDDLIQRYFIKNAFPKEALVEEILEVLEDEPDGLSKADLQRKINATSGKISAALKFLAAESPAPIIENCSKPIIFQRTLSAYELPREEIRRLSQKKEQEWLVMQTYLDEQGCLMQFLARQLDDRDAKPCGKCANCLPEDSLSNAFTEETGRAAVEFMEGLFIEVPLKSRAGVGKEDAASRFPIYDFPFNLVSAGLAHEAGRALCRWGEPGWGEIAKQGKYEGGFDLKLIPASVRLIRERWRPSPAPTWLTFVPSHAHPDLVPDFARRLAKALDLPCLDVVKKMKQNEPQKEMENSSHRCLNLDGVFQIQGDLPEGPALLVDDAFDSGWTFAVISALLRQAGAEAVLPFAIMSTSPG